MNKQAPEGQFRVIGRDDSTDSGWMKGDYPDIEEAKRATVVVGKSSFVRFQIYDDTGECVHRENQ